ncbi:Ger(x)C family spore germination protein [Clostridium sp. ZS2-4]|uniref:Ger(x)C family spore germination protein n=1 Tax=Clostridium sp. ZS2-4 TaxID=2987703 RepID=UPI00227C0353|nr:Ger(x)C family spore germination protein [Clostridium sp. ZS2-4]MCY6355638.1 Ger(x)C family spore germination protein [Clostridium sp. ZS2-4]
MKCLKKTLLISVVLINAFTFSACWDYKELSDVVNIAGVAIDKVEDKYILTQEIMIPTPEKGGTKVRSQIVITEGDSIFDAIRKSIPKTGKKIYWRHAKVVIISQKICEENIIPVIDFINRDAEPRGNMKLLVSKENTAGEILNNPDKAKDQVLSYKINNTLISQVYSAVYPVINVWRFIEDLSKEGASPIVPSIVNVKNDDKKVFEVYGSYVFNKDKLVGWLNGDESKSTLFIKDKIKSGAIVVESYMEGIKYTNTLEILGSKTKIKPIYKDNKITLNINVETDVAIAELDQKRNFIDEKGRKILAEDAEKFVETNLNNVIHKVQTKFGSDIFGFSSEIQRDMPKVWKKIQPYWEEEFKKIDTNVQVKINIKGSALMQKPIEVK